MFTNWYTRGNRNSFPNSAFKDFSGNWFMFADASGNLWRRDPSNAKRLQKSSDLGASWSNLATFTYNIGMIVVPASDPTVVLVEQDADGDWFAGGTTTTSKIYRSTDGGATFGGSAVLTFTQGGLESFSFSTYGDTIYLAEYGEYPAVYVRKSTDKGATWSTIFTHPTPASGTSHIHSVFADPNQSQVVLVTHGDNSGNRGTHVTLNDGTSWTRLTASTDFQATCVLADSTYYYFGEDGGNGLGRIHRAPRAKVLDGSFVQANDYVEVFRASNIPDVAGISYYSGYVASNGLVVLGGISYSQTNSYNNKDAIIVASSNQGAKWHIIKRYPVLPTIASGVAQIVGYQNNIWVIENGNPVTTTREIVQFSAVDIKRYCDSRN